MTDTRIQVVIDAKDNASAVFKDVNKNFAGLSGNMGAATDASKKFALAMGVAAGGLAAAGIFAVQNAREHIQVQKQLAAVLKSTGGAVGLLQGDIEAHASALSKLTNFEDDAIVSGQNLLLTFTNIKGPVFKGATEAILDMSTAMGTDLKSSAIQVGKALNNPIEGLSALSRVGVTFTEGQKKMIEGMVEAGNTMGAQQVILAELNKEFGGSAKAAADPIIQLKIRLGELAEDIGVKLLPAIIEMVGWMNKVIDVVIVAAGFLSRHSELLLVIAGGIVGALVPAFVAWATTIWTVTLPAIAAMAAALAPFALTGVLVGAIVAGALFIYKNWDTIVFNLKAIMDGLRVGWAGIWESIKDNFNMAVDNITAKIKPLIDLVDSVMSKARSFGSILGSNLFGGRVPAYSTGGMVSGPIGMPQLAVVHGGERITPINAGSGAGGGSGVTVNITGNNIGDNVDIDRLAERVGNEIMLALRRTQNV